MSPEQARGETLDGRTDLYASGIILWELLTGRQLFPSGKAPGVPKDGHTSEEILRRVRNPDLVPPSRRASRVPPELDRIALKALAPDFKNRYARCEELRSDLASFLAQHHPGDGHGAGRPLPGRAVRRGHGRRAGRARRADRQGARVVLEQALGGAAARADHVGRRRRRRAAAAAGSALPPRPPTASPGERRRRRAHAIDAGDAAAGPPDWRERGERGTVVSGPVRHDHARDKKLTVREDEETPLLTDSQLTGGRSTAVLGTVVGGRYYVRKLCGEGGMGRVYEAEHIDIGKRVALKILHPAYSQTPDLVERLRREARSASKIAHPNVVDVTDSGTTPDGAFFFVMEYLEGIELGELIYREKRLDIRRTLDDRRADLPRAAGGARGQRHPPRPEAGERPHPDGATASATSSRCWTSASPRAATTTSWARAGAGRRLTQPGMTMGTPEYMAPEQAAGKPADPRSDIYAVGGMLYEMLSGKPPYEGANFMEILHKKANSDAGAAVGRAQRRAGAARGR